MCGKDRRWEVEKSEMCPASSQRNGGEVKDREEEEEVGGLLESQKGVFTVLRFGSFNS
jgi:hypothetical protein